MFLLPGMPIYNIGESLLLNAIDKIRLIASARTLVPSVCPQTRHTKNALFHKSSPILSQRFQIPESDVSQIPTYSMPVLYCDKHKYRINPHPDITEKIITLQVSLAHDNSQSELGTQLYEPTRNILHRMREPIGFKIVKTLPFLPNSAFFFVVLPEPAPKSWHGRTTIYAKDSPRFHLMNFWYGDKNDCPSYLEGDSESMPR